MSWPFDTMEPLVAPEFHLEIMRKDRGVTPDNDTLPAVLVATFQQVAYDRMLERVGATDGVAGHGGTGGTGSRTVGTVDGVPVALARITVGAPAAALVLEMAIARGVRTILVVGSAGSLQRDLPLGSTVVMEGAEREDGTSHHYLPAGEVVTADPGLMQRLTEGARTRPGAQPRSFLDDRRPLPGDRRRHPPPSQCRGGGGGDGGGGGALWALRRGACPPRARRIAGGRLRRTLRRLEPRLPSPQLPGGTGPRSGRGYGCRCPSGRSRRADGCVMMERRGSMVRRTRDRSAPSALAAAAPSTCPCSVRE
jgi:hypothetical protein